MILSLRQSQQYTGKGLELGSRPLLRSGCFAVRVYGFAITRMSRTQSKKTQQLAVARQITFWSSDLYTEAFGGIDCSNEF